MDDYYSYDYESFDNSDTEYDEILLKMQHQENLTEIWHNCIEPSLVQIFQYIGKLVGFSFLCRLGWILLSNFHIKNGEHIISLLCGSSVLYLTIEFGFVYLLTFAIISYITLFSLVKFYSKTPLADKPTFRPISETSTTTIAINQISSQSKIGLTFGSICIIGLIICELFQTNLKLWHQVRGIQMVLTMKSISVAFDLDSKKILKFPNIFEYFGYLFCPGNCVLGPWIPYDEYTAVFNGPKFNHRWIFWILTNIIASVVFLILSNCLISVVAPAFTWKWFTAYKDALSFRNSHYFISFLSQATMSASGLVHPDYNKNNEVSSVFGYMVTKPWIMEFPRSLVQIVINWNIPMHRWLKTYVFKVIKPHSTILAIFVTYLVSSLLHGLNFQLYAVLLSLGFYTFIEHKLRNKISTIFNACLLPTACKRTCSHDNKWTKPICLAVNLLLSLSTVMHLAYLGVMFEASTTVQEQGYSIEHALNKWKSLDFLSHWTMLFSYGFYLII